MNLARVCIRRPIATIMLVMMIVVVGASSLVGIKKALFPDIEYPVALVITKYNNASPEEVEKMITEPVEEILAAVEGMESMMSMSLPEQSVVMVQFQMEMDINFATLNMREKIALIERFLPEKADKPMVFKLDLGTMPIAQVYASGDMSLDELNSRVEDSISDQLSRVAGVAGVHIVGGLEKEVALEISQETLKGYGLSLPQLAQILAGENLNLPSGEIRQGDKEIVVRTIGEFSKVDEIANLPLALRDGSIIRLGDIADISDTYKDKESVSHINGRTAIGMMITKQSDANAVEVSNAMKKKLKVMKEKYPELNFDIGFNQADFIEKALDSVSTAALTGGLLAIVIVFLFLRNIRSTLVIAMSIPISLLATFAMMKWKGMSLNLITLCALTIAVGMLVDNSIVVLENIFRIRQTAGSAAEAAEEGSKEIFLAVTASTMTTVVVFLPIALSGGITGLMFADFCFTIIIALLTSLVIAITATPMLCSLLLARGMSMDYIRLGKYTYRFKYIHKFTDGIEILKDVYGEFLKKALRKRKRVIFGSIAIFVSSIMLIGLVGTELLPEADEGTLNISAEIPSGTSLDKKTEIMEQIEKYAMGIPEVETTTLNIGRIGFFGIDTCAVYITLKDKKERDRSVYDIVEMARRDLSTISGARLTIKASDMMSEMMDNDGDLELEIMGKDLNRLSQISNEVTEHIRSMNYINSVKMNMEEGNPELRIRINRSNAAYYGVTAASLAKSLSTALIGSTATNLKVNGEEIEVNISLPDGYGDNFDNMKQIEVQGVTGMSVPVAQIAEFEFANSPVSINRLNQQRCATLAIDIAGRDLGGVSKKIFKYMDSYKFPEGYHYEVGGDQAEMADAFQSLVLALAVAVALVYLILAMQFESLTLPFMVMMSIPFAMSGAFLAMFITGTSLSMVSFLGLIMLVGIVVNNAILLVEFINHNKKLMGRDAALVEAGRMRLRPILMSSLTTCMGMVPLSIGFGNGGETLAPMGVSIIGGLMASTLVTLVLIPVLYSIFDDGRIKRELRRAGKDNVVGYIET